MRKRIGLLLYVVGGLLLSFSVGRYGIGAWRADQARQAWDAAEARQAVALARSVALHRGQPQPLVAGAPVARLVIPRLDLDEIVLEGVEGNELNAGPGHLTGTAYPGERDEEAAMERANQLVAFDLLATHLAQERVGANPVAQRRHQGKRGVDLRVGS